MRVPRIPPGPERRGVTAARIRATLLAAAVTALVVYALLTLTDPAALRRSLAAAALGPLALALLTVPLIQWLRAWRFGLLMSGSLHQPDRTLLRTAALLNLFNYLLPFRVGEASFPILMKRHYGMDYSRAAGILILVRLMDACAVVAVLCAGAIAAFDSPLRGWDAPAFAITGGAAFLALISLPLAGDRMRRVLGPRLGRWPRVQALTEGLMSGGMELRQAGAYLTAILLTLAIWVAQAAMAWLAMIAIDPGIALAPAVTAGAAANLAFALPITGIAGLGPSQAAWATALNLAGTAWDTAIASALAGYAVAFGGALLLGGLALMVPAPGRQAGTPG